MSLTVQFQKVAIGDCCQIISGSTPSRLTPEYWSGNINWFTPKDLSGIKSKYVTEAPEKITELGLRSCSTALLPEKSLLLSSRAPIGHLAINLLPSCTNQGFKSLMPKNDLDVEYLYYAIKNIVPQLHDMGNGATFKEISKAILSKVKIPVPPLAEQKKIAAILDAADSLRQKDQQLVEHYTALSKSLFLEMFGDPVTNPMGWNKITLEEAINKGFILDIQDGNHGEKHPKVSDFKDNGLPFIMANCLRDGEVDLSKSYKLHSDWLKILRVGFARAGDVLLSHKGTVGEVAVIPESVESVILSPQVTYYRTSEELDANFLGTQFACASYQQLLDKEAKQSTRAYIGITRQKQLSIIVPPIALQINFFEYLKNIKSQKEQAKTSLQKSDALFNSLLQRAFTGELTAKRAA